MSALLEDARPLGQSSFWAAMRAYYERNGVDAWRTKQVPFRPTTSPMLAHAYAVMVSAFLDDSTLDKSEPVYVVELGAGSGAFARAFVNEWYKHGPRHKQPIHFVATDGARSNVASYADSLHDAVAAGQLSFGYFDLLLPAPIQLQDGRSLLDSAPKNPVVFVANYIFDSLPSDAFQWDGQTLQSWHLALRESAETPSNVSFHEKVHAATHEFSLQPAPPGPYADPLLNQVVQRHLSEGRISFTVPTAGLACLRWLHEQAGSGYLMLAADKAFGQLGRFFEEGAPHIAHHGSQSLMANFFALGETVKLLGGVSYVSPTRHFPLLYACFAHASEELWRTRQAYFDQCEGFTVGDLTALEDAYESATITDPVLGITAWNSRMRMACYDSHSYIRTLPVLSELLQHTWNYRTRAEVRDTLLQLVQHENIALHIDVALNVGLNLVQLGMYEDALGLLGDGIKRSPHLAVFGLLGAAICCLALGQLDTMRQAYAAALRMQVSDAQQPAFTTLHDTFKRACESRGVSPV